MSVVLITGCSSGFGLGAAVALAQQGETVVATMRNPEKAGALRAAAADVEVEVRPLDVTDASSRERAVSETIAAHGQIDVLINNAGIYSSGALEELGEADLRSQFETNVFGAFEMAMAVLPAMRERRSGRIVNLTSVVSFFSPPYTAGYAASKHALDALSIGLDYELKEFNVRVTSVAPGAYGTDLKENAVVAATESLYGEGPSKRHAIWEAMLDGSPDITPVVEAIVEAATTPEPKLRYLVTSELTPPPIGAIAAIKDEFDTARRESM